MCRMLAISSRRAPSAALLDRFKALAFEGQTATLGPDARGHNDGWGMAAFVGERLIVEKSHLSITDPKSGWEEAAKRLLVPALWPGHVMIHLRRASAGMDVRTANCHPFHRKHEGRDWFLMGNGTVEGFDPTTEHGQVDFEYFFDRVLENLPEGGELKPAVHKGKASLVSKYPNFDSLVSVFMHPRGLEAYYDVADKFDRYHTLHKAETDGSLIVCSEPLEVEGVNWNFCREMGGVLSLPSFRRL